MQYHFGVVAELNLQFRFLQSDKIFPRIDSNRKWNDQVYAEFPEIRYKNLKINPHVYYPYLGDKLVYDDGLHPVKFICKIGTDESGEILVCGLNFTRAKLSSFKLIDNTQKRSVTLDDLIFDEYVMTNHNLYMNRKIITHSAPLDYFSDKQIVTAGNISNMFPSFLSTESTDTNPEYLCKRIIGYGSESNVYYVVHCKTNKDYVMKILTTTNEKSSQVWRGHDTYLTLKNPFICTLIKQYVIPPQSFSNNYKIIQITRLCAAGNLHGCIVEKHCILSENQIACIICSIAIGLNYMHKNYIMHRDLKLKNIFVHCCGVVNIGDFGYCQRSDLYKDTDIFPNLHCGTIPFMSPEMLSNNNYSTRTDSYSLGVVAYKLITFLYPYSGSTFAEIKRKVLNTSHKNVKYHCPNISDELCFLIERLLEKNSVRRITIQELLATEYMYTHMEILKLVFEQQQQNMNNEFTSDEINEFLQTITDEMKNTLEYMRRNDVYTYNRMKKFEKYKYIEIPIL
jgi:serine/threonine protein kinase